MDSSQKKQAITLSITLGEVVQSHPECVQVMLDHGLHCVGCHVAFSETIEEGASAHGMPKEELDQMIEEMNLAVQEKSSQKEPQNKDGPDDDSQNNNIAITPKSIQKIKEIFKEHKKEDCFLRIEAANQGVCRADSSAEPYSFDFEKEMKADDRLIEKEGIQILISKESQPALLGATVDYVEGKDGEGFRVEKEGPIRPKIAIDIAFLPPDDVMDKAIKMNSQLFEDPIRLNKENCLPHISLCMGVVKEEDLSKIKEIIDEISYDFSKLSLTIDKINAGDTCFNIRKNEILQRLHETIMTKLGSYLSYNATTDMCFSPPQVIEKTLFWINNYKEKSSFEKFQPHITLGISKLDNKELNIEFTASKLAICHLGNYCTCRKIIHAVNLV